MAYSDDDGETWTEIHTTSPLLYQELTECLIYDGPADDKKFILGTGKGNIFWSYDGVKWIKFLDVFPSYTPPDGLKYVYQVLYADIDANGGKGRYLAVGTKGRVTWSDDGGKTWVQHNGSDKWRYVADCTGITVQYGTGVIGGSRVKMFFGAGYRYEGSLTNEVHCYSLDGIDWVTLEEGEVAAVDFKPKPPTGANSSISWKDEADTSTLNFAVDTTIYEFQGQTGPTYSRIRRSQQPRRICRIRQRQVSRGRQGPEADMDGRGDGEEVDKR
jgi:hypothetical protein